MNNRLCKHRKSNSANPAGVLGFILVFLFSFSLLFAAVPEFVSAQNYGLDVSANTAKLPTADVNFPSKIGKIVGIGLSFVGVLFLILIIYAGIMWMTAAGNETQVGKAKDIIIAAVIGLVVVLAAYAITKFVGDMLTS